MKKSRLVLLSPLGALALVPLVQSAAPAAAKAPRRGTLPVVVRVEGMRSTLLAETRVAVSARRIDPDGKPADSCTGLTAAAALQEATHGHWVAGKYSSGLGYPVIGVLGESHPFTSDYYWALWIDGKPATVGICGATLSAGEQLLLFPQCSQESAAGCPQGMLSPPVLQLSGPRRARAGATIRLRVHALANATGAATPAGHVEVRAGSVSATTNAAGEAHLRLAHKGRVRVVAEQTGAVRDELTVVVGGR